VVASGGRAGGSGTDAVVGDATVGSVVVEADGVVDVDVDELG